MNAKIFKFFLLSLSLLLLLPAAQALTLPLPPAGDDIVGELKYVKARSGDTLASVARRYNVGIDEMEYANRGVSRHRRLSGGYKLLVPTQFILPSGPREGIVINLAEMRLYYYPAGRNVVITEPVGIGREEERWHTPVGTTRVTAKEADPGWRPTENVRAEAARNGTPIPAYFPPGPNNPLGRHVLRLGWPTYLIHGTNRPEGVGSRVSAGCIRMYPESIKRLYQNVPVGTSVRVVNEPFKAGWSNGKLYFEAHKPLTEDRKNYTRGATQAVNAVHNSTDSRNASVQWSKVKRIAYHPSGVPAVVSN